MANFYRIGAAGLDWKTTGSWSSTSGGGSNGIDEPTSTDDIFFDSNSPTTVTITSAASGNILSCNNGSLVITFNGANLILQGQVSLSAAATFTATTSETLTCYGLSLGGAGTYNLSGSVKFIFKGGTITSGSTTRNIGVSYDLDGNVTYSGLTDHNGTITITYVSGTITTTGHNFNVSECTAVTLNTSGVNWNTVTEGPITLTSDLNVYGTFVKSQSMTTNKTTTEAVNIYGTLSVTHAGTGGLGTATFKMQAGSTWSGSSAMRQNIEFVGNCTVSGTVGFRDSTITYTSGTITTTGSTITITAAATFNTPSASMSWNNLSTTGTGTILTLLADCNCTGTWTNTAHSTMAGSGGTRTLSAAGFNYAAANAGLTAGSSFKLILTGGTWTCGSSTMRTTFNVDVQGNVTLGTVSIGAGTITYISGTVVTGGSLNIRGDGSVIFNTNGMIWGSVATATSIAITLTSDFSCSYCSFATSIVTINRTTTETWTTLGGINIAVQVSGTAKIIWKGGAWTSNGNTLWSNLDIDGNCTVSGTVSYRGGTMTYISGTVTTTGSTLNVRDGTYNTNGIIWNNVGNAGAAGTCTLTSNMYIGGLLNIGTTTVNFNTSGGFTLTCAGGISNGSGIAGTAKIIWTGGTWSGNGQLTSSIDVNGNVTISGTNRYLTGTFTYVSGTISWVSSAYLAIQGNCTFNTSGVVLQSGGISGGPTVTLTSNWYWTALDISSSATINRTTTEIAHFSGINVGATFTLGGSAEIQLTGGGTWTGSGIVNSTLNINGNTTISGTVTKGINSLIYTSGTITTTGSTLQLVDSATINTAGMTWNLVTLSTATGKTYTLTSTFAANTLELGTGATKTFAGTAGFDVGTLSCAATTAAQTVNLKEAITYTVNNLFSCYQTRVGLTVLFTSSHASTRANILLPNNGSNLCNVLANFTRIDASGGRSINTFGGTITDCINVNQYYDYKAVGI